MDSPDPATAAAIATWIELAAGRVPELTEFQRGLLAEQLRDGTWRLDPERRGARTTAAAALPFVAWVSRRPLTDLERVAAEDAARRLAPHCS